MEEGKRKPISPEREQGYRCRVKFNRGGMADLITDEREPLGGGEGPSPGMLLQTAIANCLASSLLFCLEKAKQRVGRLHTDVTGTMMRNARGRLRVGKLDVRITLDMAADQPERVTRCFELFEDYCVVSASVRRGIPLSVVIVDADGRELYRKDDPAREPA